MSKRKAIKSNQKYDAAISLEKSENIDGAIKLLQKATATDPTNIRAWNRLMILFRKSKTKKEEIKLISTALTEFKKSTDFAQQAWLIENQEKVNSTRELAKVLGIVEENGMPKVENSIIEKWQTRLYLLEYRVKNTRKITKKATGIPSQKTKALIKTKPIATMLKNKPNKNKKSG